MSQRALILMAVGRGWPAPKSRCLRSVLASKQETMNWGHVIDCGKNVCAYWLQSHFRRMNILTAFPSAAGGQPSMPDEHTLAVLCFWRCMTAKTLETLEADSSVQKNSMILIHCREARLLFAALPIYPTGHCVKVGENLQATSSHFATSTMKMA